MTSVCFCIICILFLVLDLKLNFSIISLSHTPTPTVFMCLTFISYSTKRWYLKILIFFFPSGTQPCRHWLEKTMEETCICHWRINAALIVWFSAWLTLFQCPSSALCNSWGIITFKPQSKIWGAVRFLEKYTYQFS